MTWYSYKAWQAVTAKQQQDEKHHSNYGYNYCHKIIDKNSNKVNVTLVVSNMRTDKDQQNIVNHLKKTAWNNKRKCQSAPPVVNFNL